MRMDEEIIHGWFGLTYANYLVLPRTVLQSMPSDWQRRFVDCLERLEEAAWDLPMPGYDVRVLARSTEWIQPDCEECEGEGEIEGGSCDACDGEGTDPEGRYETAEEVGFISDPIPHYSRRAGARRAARPTGQRGP